MAIMDAHMAGSIAPMAEAREAFGFNAEEECCYQSMKYIAPKWGWPRGWERVWTIEDRNRYDRYTSDPFNEKVY